MAIVDAAGNIYNVVARPRIVFTPSPAQAGVTVAASLITFTTFTPATYTSGDIAVDPYTELTTDFDLTVLSGGGTAQFLVDRKSASGGYFPILTSVAMTGVGTQSATIGSGYPQSGTLGTATGLSFFSVAQGFGDLVRIRVIVVTGTLTATLSLKGK